MIEAIKIIPGGQTLATLPDGKKIFFWGALPGEIVESYDVTKTKSHYLEAIVREIESPSPYRIIPKDECYLSTSPWQIMDYNYELKTKQSLVVEMFREHQIDISLPPIHTDHKEYFYRNKMEYALYWDHETAKIKLAFHQRGSHRKIPIKSSSIERPELFQAATEIIDKLNQKHEEARKYQSMLLRCNQKGEVSGGLYENHHPHPVFSHLTDTILGHPYSYSPNGFFQINLPVYEMALTEIKKHITTDDVLDLYAGVGTIGLSVAEGRNLTLVEVDKNAFSELEKNCKMGLSEEIRSHDEDERADPVTDRPLGRGRPEGSTGVGDALRGKSPFAVLAKSEESLNYLNFNQTVILDPPRAGCDKKLIEKLLEVKPRTIIYLSCNPATQARDTKILLKNYQIKDIKTYNFFPRTPHIENLLILELKD